MNQYADGRFMCIECKQPFTRGWKASQMKACSKRCAKIRRNRQMKEWMRDKSKNSFNRIVRYFKELNRTHDMGIKELA